MYPVSTPPQATGQISPDGLWRWDGVRWIPVAAAAPSTPDVRRSSLAIGGGITAFLGAIVLGVGSAIPYVHYTGDTSGQYDWPSVFNGGFTGAWGDAVEPALVIVIAIAAGI